MERVVLLDESGQAIGTAPKATVHDERTPLHLAFSCYVFDSGGRLLLTRRALSKPTWPGVWTNSCCGHPGPGEPMEAGVLRRLKDELGLTVHRLELVLPRFRYRAVMPNGVVENELCPVYLAFTEDTPSPEPSEVEEVDWVDWVPFARSVLDGERAVSPWCAEQVPALAALGDRPTAWPVARPDTLPPAARN